MPKKNKENTGVSKLAQAIPATRPAELLEDPDAPLKPLAITLTQLRYFVQCARMLNMTEASSSLRVAQSAVSTAIAGLEKTLGVSLFIRVRSKGLVLTPAGTRLLLEAQNLFHSLQLAIDDIRGEHASLAGSVKIAVFNTLAPFILPQLHSALNARYPRLTVETCEGDYRENLDLLRQGRVDMAINYLLASEADVDVLEVGEAMPYVLLAEGHPLAGEGSVFLRQLRDDPYVMLDLAGSSEYFSNTLLSAGVTARVAYRTSSYETVRAMVAAGFGFSLLNQRPGTAWTYAAKNVVELEIRDSLPSLRIVVCTLRGQRPSGRVRAVSDELAKILACYKSSLRGGLTGDGKVRMLR